MRAVVLRQFGSPQQLRVEEVSEPTIRDDQMLVRVEACGVCGHDLLNRSGSFPRTRLPAVLGHEIAGVVVRTGNEIGRFVVGDRVALLQRQPCGHCAVCRAGRENICRAGDGFYGEDISGGYGDFVTASELNALPLPREIPTEIGAVIGCALGTGYHALRRSGALAGDSVVITGAGGGVGLHTLQVARMMGLKAIAITTSAKKAPELHAAGADEVIDAGAGEFHTRVRSLTQGEGAAAVIEIAGSPTFASSVRAVRPTGRVVLVGNVIPAPVSLNPAFCILKEIDVVGSGHVTLKEMQQVIDWVRQGKLAPSLAFTMASTDAATAHEQMEKRATTGRVVLLHRE